MQIWSVPGLILIKATLGQFFPMFGDGSTAVAILAASIIVWAVHALALRGIRETAMLNTIATFAKMVPIGIFIVVVIWGFKADVFAANFWGGEAPTLSNIASQVRDTLLATVFVFVGIEGASVYSRSAHTLGRHRASAAPSAFWRSWKACLAQRALAPARRCSLSLSSANGSKPSMLKATTDNERSARAC